MCPYIRSPHEAAAAAGSSESSVKYRVANTPAAMAAAAATPARTMTAIFTTNRRECYADRRRTPKEERHGLQARARGRPRLGRRPGEGVLRRAGRVQPRP